jgi:photosystem II stability/assembly factor-like uncharacterized protein
MPDCFLTAYRSALLSSLISALLVWNCLGAQPETPQSRWVSISDAVLRQLAADGKKTDWPGETAGIAVDPSNGDVYMIVTGQGVWKSVDHGNTFERCDGGKVGGRCETAFSLNVDPAGKRLACFMLDGKGAWTVDGGRTWQSLADVGRNWDFAAVDWSTPVVKNIVAGLHESGGQVMLSTDGGRTWEMLFRDPEFDKSGGLGIFNEKTLVCSQKGKGIQRSIDGGRTWTKTSDFTPIGRVVRVLNGTAYWLSADGLLVSDDHGASWRIQGSPTEASIGPWLDPKNGKRVVVAGIKGIFRSVDAGQTWKQIAILPAGADIPKPGWYSNVAWDPVSDIFYVSKMGKPAYRLDADP